MDSFLIKSSPGPGDHMSTGPTSILERASLTHAALLDMMATVSMYSQDLAVEMIY